MKKGTTDNLRKANQAVDSFIDNYGTNKNNRKTILKINVGLLTSWIRDVLIISALVKYLF